MERWRQKLKYVEARLKPGGREEDVNKKWMGRREGQEMEKVTTQSEGGIKRWGE